MNVLFCGGGTVGHISPALAIAEEFKKRHPECKIAFVGRLGGKENEIVRKSGYTLYEIRAQGLIRRLTLKNVRVLKNMITAEKEAKEIIKVFKPDAVIGTGGYVSFPVIRAAAKLGIYTAIHESNATFGLSSKLLARKCNAVFLGSKATEGVKNSVYTGNPVKEEFYKLTRTQARRELGIPSDAFLILSVGGSLGAEVINGACIKTMRHYAKESANVFHYHSTGARYFEKAKAICPEFSGNGPRFKILPYIERMPIYLAASDVVISRCGAMTLSEIAASGTPSVLIPSPNVSADHQTKNALYFAQMGAGIIINETELSEKVLVETVDTLMRDSEKLKAMSDSARTLASYGAAEKIVKSIERGLET